MRISITSEVVLLVSQPSFYVTTIHRFYLTRFHSLSYCTLGNDEDDVITTTNIYTVFLWYTVYCIKLGADLVTY